MTECRNAVTQPRVGERTGRAPLPGGRRTIAKGAFGAQGEGEVMAQWPPAYAPAPWPNSSYVPDGGPGGWRCSRQQC